MFVRVNRDFQRDGRQAGVLAPRWAERRFFLAF